MPPSDPERAVSRPLPFRLGTDFKVLCRNLQEALAQIERMEDLSTVLEGSLECLLDRFEDELGLKEAASIGGRAMTSICGGVVRGAPRAVAGAMAVFALIKYVATLLTGLLLVFWFAKKSNT